MENGIVVLNYLNYEITIKTVELLLNQKNIENFSIVIVDNGSNNGSVEFLKENFGKIHNIKIISISNNLGFARGNNLGIRYLRSQNVKNILIMNSDISFLTTDGLSDLFKDIPKGVGVIGPDIIGKNGEHANPIYLPVGIIGTLERLIYNMLGGALPKKIKQKVKKKTNGKISQLDLKSEQSKTKKDFFVHGASFLLTANYFDILPELYPKTFLYYEAQILKILSKKYNLKYYFNASVTMKHIEDQSSALSYGNKTDIKQKMVAKSQYEAIILYFKLLCPNKFIKKWKKNNEDRVLYR